MCTDITDIARMAATACRRGRSSEAAELFSQACVCVRRSVAAEEFLGAFALEAARAIDDGMYTSARRLYDCTCSLLGGYEDDSVIRAAFSAQGAGLELQPTAPSDNYSMVALVMG